VLLLKDIGPRAGQTDLLAGIADLKIARLDELMPMALRSRLSVTDIWPVSPGGFAGDVDLPPTSY
jgi:hypothetical protein